MHMTYRCENGHSIRIWNSRDGVTPFGMMCLRPYCEAHSKHAEWNRDIFDPTHDLKQGDYYWRDGTAEEAKGIIYRRLAKAEPSPAKLADMGYETLFELVNDLAEADEFQDGWPQLAQHTPPEALIEAVAGDAHIIGLVAQVLLDAFDDFIAAYDGGGRVDFIDRVMGVHNAYRYVVIETVKQSGDPIWYDVAADTFSKAMAREKLK